MQINFGARSVSCKIVYYGPGLSGKTTNIQRVHELAPGDRKSNLTSIKTEGDRTLFFDFMSLDLGSVAGMETRFSLYTVPGQVYYDATRKLVLQGADGLIFVADSSPDRMADNVESWVNLQENLAERGISVKGLPVVLQWNKRDVPGALSVEELNRQINTIGAPTFESVATTGQGVLETLKCMCGMVCKTLNDKQMKSAPAARTSTAAQAAATSVPAEPAAVSASAMSFASRRMGAGASTGSASAVMDAPKAPAAPAAAARPKPAAPVAAAPMPPKPKPREVAPVTAQAPSAPAWTTRKTVIVVAGLAAAVAAALAAALMTGIL